MAVEHPKQLREFGEAITRWAWAAFDSAATPGGGAEDEALYRAARETGLRYPPFVEAVSNGTDERDAFLEAVSDYSSFVISHAASRGAGAVALAVAVILLLRLWTGSSPAENFEAALLSMSWWGAPSVFVGGFVWGMRRSLRLYPLVKCDWLRRIIVLSACSLRNRFSLAAVSLGLGALIDSRCPGFASRGFVVGAALACVDWGRLWRAIRRKLAQPI